MKLLILLYLVSFCKGFFPRSMKTLVSSPKKGERALKQGTTAATKTLGGIRTGIYQWCIIWYVWYVPGMIAAHTLTAYVREPLTKQKNT